MTDTIATMTGSLNRSITRRSLTGDLDGHYATAGITRHILLPDLATNRTLYRSRDYHAVLTHGPFVADPLLVTQRALNHHLPMTAKTTFVCCDRSRLMTWVPLYWMPLVMWL